MKLRIFEYFDYFLILCVSSLVVIGIMFIYSSGINSEGVLVSNEYIKQIIWASTGLIFMLLFNLSDYRKVSRYAPYLYAFLVIILLYTRIFGRFVNGARSWIGFGGFGIQPSEFCKIIFIIFLAWYFERSSNEKPLKRFLISFVIFLVPVGLILLQPDLGTAMVYIPIYLIMSFLALVPLRYISLVFFTGMATIFFAVLPIYQSEIAHSTFKFISILTNQKLLMIVIVSSFAICLIGILGKIFFPEKKYFYWISYVFGIICTALILSIVCSKVLKDYQIKRLIVFIDPNSDPRGAGWNIIQSKIAIGSGNLFGRGYLQGTQSHYRFLPEQSTDFIFSILSEEFGFVGGVVVFLLYFGILMRMIFILKKTANNFGYLICGGIIAMFFFHFIINVGMVMGIMPITGIPLLFLSYGGSSLWTAMFSIGLVMSINSHKFVL